MSEAANPDERVIVPIDSAIERFSRHMDAAGNTFVIVSGRYGIGKTFFLKEFFQIHGEQYHPIFISPLKYAINRSENIFELIKLDIAMELFRKGYLEPTDPKKTSDLKSLAGYARKKTLPLAKHFLKAISKMDPLTSVASVASDGVAALIDDFAGYEEERNVELNIESPAVQLSLFLEKMFEKKGHFGEKDIVTEAIEQFLQEQRSQDEEGKEKEWVLVVDDFDRIDPEHIFRILNVLSAHRDEEGQGFKFGFDKMILVMDFDNLKDLYLHKYGEKANFTGYIDKFYSHEVFYFKIQDTVRDFFDRQIKTQFPEDVKELFHRIICGLFEKETITMRQLVRAKGFEAVAQEEIWLDAAIYGQKVVLCVRDIPFVQIFPLLARILGGFQGLSKLLSSHFKLPPESEISNGTLFKYFPIFLSLESGEIIQANGDLGLKLLTNKKWNFIDFRVLPVSHNAYNDLRAQRYCKSLSIPNSNLGIQVCLKDKMDALDNFFSIFLRASFLNHCNSGALQKLIPSASI